MSGGAQGEINTLKHFQLSSVFFAADRIQCIALRQYLLLSVLFPAFSEECDHSFGRTHHPGFCLVWSGFA